MAELLRRLLNSPQGAIGLTLLAVTVAAVLIGPWIAPQNPFDIATLDILDSKMPPGSTNMDGSMTYWLGTDGQARGR